MKFQVREGFVIHDTRLVKNGDKQVEQTNSYFEGNNVDFDEATAASHLHKLEPLDKEAKAFSAARVAPVSPPPVAGMDPAALAALIAQAVATAMATMTAQTSAQPAAPVADTGKPGA